MASESAKAYSKHHQWIDDDSDRATATIIGSLHLLYLDYDRLENGFRRYVGLLGTLVVGRKDDESIYEI